VRSVASDEGRPRRWSFPSARAVPQRYVAGPWENVRSAVLMLVAIPVSSMNTSLSSSQPGVASLHARRAGSTSSRSCSLACRVFFERKLPSALDRGDRPTEIARRFEVSRVWVYRVRNRLRDSGERGSFQIGGHRQSCLAEFLPMLRGWIEAEPILP
jgi:hypothetical protein